MLWLYAATFLILEAPLLMLLTLQIALVAAVWTIRAALWIAGRRH